MRKRIFDFVLSLLALILFVPLWFIFILFGWLENRGIAIYIHERIGRNGRTFKLFKFRTMDSNENIKGRISKLMRMTAMDEAPQLVNILKGDMSFVGPRPLIKEEVEAARNRNLLEERLKVTPGLTGVSQILLPKNAAVDEKMLFDMWYIRNKSLLLDLKVIFISILVAFLGRWEAGADKLAILRQWREKIKTEINSK